MSKLVINGITVFNTQDSSAPTKGHVSSVSPKVEPSFATHRLVDGNWVPKGSAPAPVVTPAKPAIGFIQPAPAVPSVPTPKGSVSYFGSRKEYLRAIEIAAGKTLLAGTNTKAIDAIRRGRLGGRKDNMAELHALLVEYSA
jgi:hypothetical protein